MLSLLSPEEKEDFLELALFVAQSDESLKPEEQHMIRDFREKLDLKDYKIANKSFEQILSSLEESSFVSKTSMLLELLSVCISDDKYSRAEQEIIDKLRRRWGVTDEQFVSIVHWLKDKHRILKAEGLNK
jgi:uncharacterized tellurite resistance protein B-like protein